MTIILKLFISKMIGYSVVDILYITVVSCSGDNIENVVIKNQCVFT